MGRDYEIVVFTDEWNGLPFSCKHLLRQCLPDVPLIWVETIGLRSPKLSLYDIKRVIKKSSGWFSSRRSDSNTFIENLQILDSFQIPYNHIDVVRRFNKRVMIAALNQLYRSRPRRERVLITTWPFVGNLVGCLGERLSVYYRVDDFSEFPQVRKSSILRLERELIEKVDMVVATAENLMQVDMDGKVVKYLPHGVDFEHFSPKGVRNGKDLPIQRILSPRIGFFGLLNSWIDFDLLSRVAKTHPSWSIVLIGPSQIPLSALPSAPNIHFLGPVSYEDLPAHAMYFDVGLIPFKVNALTQSVNPLKLMEYLSLGLPVVSTPLPEVIRYKNLVAIASGHDDFGDAVQRAIKEDNPNLRLLRQRVAKDHSWKKKSLELRGWIEEALERKLAISH